METFAEYILSEQDVIRKMEIVYYLQKRTGVEVSMMWLYSQSLKMHIYTKFSISCLYLLT